MACERYAKTLADLAAGARAPAATEEHLAACATCRAELLALRETLALAAATLRAVVAEEPRPELFVRIRQAATAARGPQGAPLPRRRTWVAATAALGLIIAAYGYVTSLPPAVPPSSAVTSQSADAREGSRMEPTGHPPVGGQAPQSARVARAVLVSPAAVNGHRRPRGAAESRTEQPMVLVPAGEREALVRFAAQLRERTVAPDSLLVADPLRELPPVEPVRIEPLEIAPLAEAGKS